MTQKRKKQIRSEVVSIRFPAGDFINITKEAEEKNTSIAEVMRGAWREHLLQRDIHDSLAVLEQRLIRKTFEIVSVVAGVDDQERLLAWKKFKVRMKQEVAK